MCRERYHLSSETIAAIAIYGVAAISVSWGASLFVVMALAGHFDLRPRDGAVKFEGGRSAVFVAAFWIWSGLYKSVPDRHLPTAVVVSRALTVVTAAYWTLLWILPRDFAERWAAGTF
jgi:hypothetical protein